MLELVSIESNKISFNQKKIRICLIACVSVNLANDVFGLCFVFVNISHVSNTVHGIMSDGMHSSVNCH